MSRLLAGLALAPLLLLPAPVAAEGQADGCAAHALTPATVKEELRTWSGLGAFAQWRLLRVDLDPCAREGRVTARLELAPPEKWSRRGLPFRLRLELALDAGAGRPFIAAPEGWRALAAEVKRMVAELEGQEDVARFLERFAAVDVDLRPEPGGAGLLATVRTDPGPQHAVERGAALTFRLGAKGAVVAYQLQRMDDWPARRELLRFLEVLSQRHPGCRPVWIEARSEPPTPQPAASAPAEPAPPWTLRADLAAGEPGAGGAACPATFQAAIAPDGVVADVLDGDGQERSKGD